MALIRFYHLLLKATSSLVVLVRIWLFCLHKLFSLSLCHKKAFQIYPRFLCLPNFLPWICKQQRAIFMSIDSHQLCQKLKRRHKLHLLVCIVSNMPLQFRIKVFMLYWGRETSFYPLLHNNRQHKHIGKPFYLLSKDQWTPYGALWIFLWIVRESDQIAIQHHFHQSRDRLQWKMNSERKVTFLASFSS